MSGSCHKNFVTTNIICQLQVFHMQDYMLYQDKKIVNHNFLKYILNGGGTLLLAVMNWQK